MNIQIQLCGMIILVLMLVFYKTHKTLQLYTEKVFFRNLAVTIITLALDIVSLVMIHFMEKLPLFIVVTVCKLYIVTLLWETMFALSYVLTDLFSEIVHTRMTKLMVLLSLVESVIVMCLPIEIYKDAEVAYTYGAATLCVYGFVALNIIATLAVCFGNKKLNKRRAFAVILWMLIWIAAAVTQFFNSELLVVGYAGAVGVLIIFVIMENPEANIDRRLGCFNSYALTEYMDQLFERQQGFSVFDISFDNCGAADGDPMCADSYMRSALDVVGGLKDVFAFRNLNSGIVIIAQDAEKLQKTGCEMLEILSGRKMSHKQMNAVMVKNGGAFKTMDELFGFVAFIRARYLSEKSELFVADDDIIAGYRERHVIEHEISDALAEDRIEVFLQPIFSNNEACFTSAEALVRLRKRDGSLMSPGIFIPIAEESGQILELGERVFEKVCEFLKNTDAVQLGIHYIEVNLSVVQCEMEDLADRLIALIEKYGISPSLINLEITETASVTARATLLANMNRLIEYGFTFSLDDFGKGESNLMYVVEMPVSIIKLDLDMSKAFFSSQKAKQVVRAVVGMAHGMDLRLVAEGIETKDEIEGMYQEEIDYIQGYYYSRPLPMPEFLEFLRNS